MPDPSDSPFSSPDPELEDDVQPQTHESLPWWERMQKSQFWALLGVVVVAVTLVGFGISLGSLGDSDNGEGGVDTAVTTGVASPTTSSTQPPSTTSPSTEPDTSTVAEPEPSPVETVPLRVATRDGAPTAMLITSEGRLVVVGEDGFGAQVWDLAGVEPPTRYDGHGNADLGAVAELPDGRVVTGGDRGLQVWRIGTDSPEVEKEQGAVVQALAVLDDGRVLSGHNEGMIRAWALPNTEDVEFDLRAHFEAGQGNVRQLRSLGEGEVISAGDNGIFRWTAPDPTPGVQTSVRDGWDEIVDYTVEDLGVLPSGDLVLVAPADQPSVVRVLSRATNQATTEYPGHTDAVSALAVLSDGRVASADEGGAIHIWRPGEEDSPEVLDLYDVGIVAIAATGDDRLVIAVDDGQIAILDTAQLD